MEDDDDDDDNGDEQQPVRKRTLSQILPPSFIYTVHTAKTGKNNLTTYKRFHLKLWRRRSKTIIINVVENMVMYVSRIVSHMHFTHILIY